MHGLLLLTGFLLTSSTALAQFQSSDGSTEPIVAAIGYNTVRFSRNADATRTNQKITIDGRLDETVWQTASPAGDFIQWEPSPGEEATEPTEVRFLYDDANLYIGVICYESDPDNLRITELDEDFNGQNNDGFGITLDTLKDERSGFFFGTNPAGAKRDMQIANDGFAMNQDWDGVWDVRVALDGEAWIAEFVIPLKTLRFANDGPQEWGLNMVRRVRRKNEDSYWSPLLRRYRVNRISMTGTLRGVEVGSMGPNLKVNPFATTAFSQIRTDGNLDSDTDFDGGLDAKYGVTSSLTLDLTYRTDFSQVEADQQQVNLTRISLFFPEKRECFLENSGIFGFGQPLNRFRRELWGRRLPHSLLQPADRVGFGQHRSDRRRSTPDRPGGELRSRYARDEDGIDRRRAIHQLSGRESEEEHPRKFLDRRHRHESRQFDPRGLQPTVRNRLPIPVASETGDRFLPARKRHTRQRRAEPGATIRECLAGRRPDAHRGLLRGPEKLQP